MSVFEEMERKMFHGLGSVGSSICTTGSTTNLTSDDVMAAVASLKKNLIPFAQPGAMGGMRIVEMPDYMERVRPWRERLWSWPWCPWRRMQRSPGLLSCGQCIISHISGTVFMSKSDAAQLREAQRRAAV